MKKGTLLVCFLLITISNQVTTGGPETLWMPKITCKKIEEGVTYGLYSMGLGVISYFACKYGLDFIGQTQTSPDAKMKYVKNFAGLGLGSIGLMAGALSGFEGITSISKFGSAFFGKTE